MDSNIVRKSLELADVNPNDCIVEIGPGLGTLTGALISRGARVWAVEIDPELYAYLRDTFRDEENLNLINADALEFPLAGLPPDVPDFKIVANLPYYITTPIIMKLLLVKGVIKLVSLLVNPLFLLLLLIYLIKIVKKLPYLKMYKDKS